jgi:uncharacterized protein with HEPN domain
MWRDDAHLLDIVLAARKALTFTDGLTFDRFAGSELHQAAVVRMLEIVGEAAGRLSNEFRDSHPDIPWKQIVGMRNRLIHDYTNVDLPRVWEVVSVYLPELVQRIAPLLPPPE